MKYIFSKSKNVMLPIIMLGCFISRSAAQSTPYIATISVINLGKVSIGDTVDTAFRAALISDNYKHYPSTSASDTIFSDTDSDFEIFPHSVTVSYNFEASDFIYIKFHPRSLSKDTVIYEICSTGSSATISPGKGIIIGEGITRASIVQRATLFDSLSIIEEESNYVKLNAEMSGPEEATVIVYNLLGQPVFTKGGVLEPEQNFIYVPTIGWPNGTYFAELLLANRVLQKRFIVEH